MDSEINLKMWTVDLYARYPLNTTGKNLHYVEFALSETDPFQTNSLSQCDILSALVEFVLNEQFINSR